MKYSIIKNEKDRKKADSSSLKISPKWSLEEIALPQSILDEIENIIAYVNNKEKLLILT